MRNPCPNNLSHLAPNGVGMVTPVSGSPSKGFKFAPLVAWNTVVGDEDGDGDYFDSNLFDKIDALQIKVGPPTRMKDMRKLYFSVSGEIGDSVSGVMVRPADIVRVMPDGLNELFITADLICQAFGMNCSYASVLNVDALTFKPPEAGDPGGIYLSFEESRDISIGAGSYLVEDGAILCIPGSAITWAADQTVAAVTAGGGQIVLMEVDAFLSTNIVVDNSGVADFLGNHPTTIGDLDGLEIDPAGGKFHSEWGMYHHLMFCGETLTGGGVVSTEPNPAGAIGSIARVNGALLASPAPQPTTGSRVGLAGASVGSLNGLALGSSNLVHYVTDTDYPESPSPNVQILVGSEFSGLHYLAAAYIPAGSSATVAPSTIYSNPGFPDFFGTIYPVTTVTIPAGSYWSSLIYPVADLPPWLGPGTTLIIQAAWQDSLGSYILSTPMTITL